ncbi:MAG TPA: hypothetical protein PLP34_05970 [Chitinophagaceae bacterium]|nr:hypothetical protein [Chitinophagaceae bacterium]HNF71937.1 hypothetical protein [Chitinophagaceae bacterium]
MKRYLFLLLLLSILYSCKREVIPPGEIEIGKEYFPLQTGHFIEYEVDSLRYNTFNHDTEYAHLYMRDEVGDKFYDNEGRESYFIKRFIRYNDTSAWNEVMTWYATQTNYRLEIVEDNLRFVKLIFPVKGNAVWNGNVYLPASATSLEEVHWYLDWDYKYRAINESFDNGKMVFPNCVTVQASIGPKGTGLINDSTSTVNYSEFTAYQEVYSQQIGPVFRYLTHWEFQPTEGFRNGFSVVFRAINHN